MDQSLTLRLEAFTKLSPDDRAAVNRLAAGKIQEVAPRRDLVREGEPPRFVHLVLQGWGCRYKTLDDGRRQIVSLFVPGDFCDLNVYILKKMDHSIGAISRMRVAQISREDMDALTEQHPRVTQALLWQELVDVAVQREWTLNVGQRSSYERIGHLFVEMFFRLRAIGMTSGNSFDFPLIQTDIAEATGLTPVHVNRTLQALRSDGLLELQARRVTLPDLDRLMGVSLFNPDYLHLGHEGRHLDANA
ncbi:MAG TPA: Crp/Fnr family transcriptional regulator [Sphingomicrobium sp.]